MPLRCAVVVELRFRGYLNGKTDLPREICVATTERTVRIALPSDEALKARARALALAGFKNIQVHDLATMVTGEKRVLGQWTKGQLVAVVETLPEETASNVTIRSRASAQSLVGLASSPTDRLIDQVVAQLPTM